MLNQSGIKKTSATTRKTILIAPELAFSLSCKIDGSSVTPNKDGKKIVLAGTPLAGDLESRDTAFTVANSGQTPCGIVLHDVEITEGTVNSQVVIFGFVDTSKLDSTVVEALSTMREKLPKITFVK